MRCTLGEQLAIQEFGNPVLTMHLAPNEILLNMAVDFHVGASGDSILLKRRIRAGTEND